MSVLPIFVPCLKALHYVTPMRVWPPFMLRMPGYVQARKQIFSFAEQIASEHVSNPDSGDLVDELLAAHQGTDELITREQLIAQLFVPYFVGIDTVAATTSFLIYLLLRHEDVLRQVIEEIDIAHTLEAIDLNMLTTLDRALYETQRLYPVAPLLARRVMRSFTFKGYRVAAGTELVIATGVTHYLPEFYPEPHQFDINRRNAVPVGVFTGWGVGPHFCLGATLAPMLLKVMMVALLTNWTPKLHPANYPLKISLAPIPNPGPSLKIHVARRH